MNSPRFFSSPLENEQKKGQKEEKKENQQKKDSQQKKDDGQKNEKKENQEGKGKEPSEPPKETVLDKLIARGGIPGIDLVAALEAGSKLKRTYSEFMFLQEMTEAMDTLVAKKSNADKRQYATEMCTRRPLISGQFLHRNLRQNQTFRVVVRDPLEDTKNQKVLNLDGAATLKLAEALGYDLISSNTALFPKSNPKSPQFERIPDDDLATVFVVDMKRLQYNASRYGHSAFGISTKGAGQTVEEKVLWITPDATTNDQWTKCFLATEALLNGFTVSFMVRR